MYQSEERLYFLRHVCEGGRDASLKLRRCFRVIALPKFVLTGGNEECLLRPEATFFDGETNLVPQFGGRVSKIARDHCFSHEKSPYLAWCQSGATVCCIRPSSMNVNSKQLTQNRTTKWPQPFMFQYQRPTTTNPRPALASVPILYPSCCYLSPTDPELSLDCLQPVGNRPGTVP